MRVKNNEVEYFKPNYLYTVTMMDSYGHTWVKLMTQEELDSLLKEQLERWN